MASSPRTPPASKRSATRRGTPKCASSSTPNQNDSTPLPSINERLAYLRPSRELLEYYRKKIAQFDEEHEELVKRLEKYKATYDEQHKLQWEMRQREEEIAELQKALSDMQVYLFQEREHVLRLYAENDRLKIRELEDRKKIQHLLALVGPDNGEITYFHKEPPHKVTVPQRLTKRRDPYERNENSALKTGVKSSASKTTAKGGKPESAERYQRDNQTLLLQVEALQAQLEEQARLAKEQLEALLEDRRIRIEEAQVQHQRDQDKIKDLTEKYHKAQNLLYESTRDFLQLKFEARTNEKSWMAEKDCLLRRLDKRKGGPERSRVRWDGDRIRDRGRSPRDSSHDWQEESSQDEGGSSPCQHSFSQKLRGSAEKTGEAKHPSRGEREFRKAHSADIKVTMTVGPDQDLAILHEVRQGNQRTKKIQGELKNLKSKIYSLENELRVC
ncbi:PREDICTED: coiled-coil domain-containing protein 77 [Gekko japonicus]|uniref:Coiled-coil domain-containing protein 77 n=1 Tax=Gekko japonicus TaxID=146911 RepID=A0ABM1KDH4_GEKJA|nr:PREDICTED: coiled-coil domain-containing protein 77 [Gekko japonicus]